jgi:hypothetical protein
VDLDEDAAAVPRLSEGARSMALQLITPGSLVFGDMDGTHARNPEHVSQQVTQNAFGSRNVPAHIDGSHAT